MRILKINQKSYQKIAKIVAESVKNGKVIIFPTDTVYGLICDVQNKKAVSKIFKIKKRNFQKKISIFVRDLEMAKKFAKIDKKQEQFLKKNWPGNLIAVLKAKKKFPKGIVCPKGKIGLRIPNYKFLNELLKKWNYPIAQTSANISGKPVPAKVKEILKQFRDKNWQPDLVIDAEKLAGKPSAVIDLTISPPKILRP